MRKARTGARTPPPPPNVSPARVEVLVDALAHATMAARHELDDARVRSTLQLLAEIFELPDDVEQRVRPNPLACPNCDTPATDLQSKKVFCSENCAQESGLIRYVRRAIVDGRIGDVDVLRDGIGTPLLMVRSGGYPTLDRTVPPAMRTFIIERDGGRCKICGINGANEIDHINGNSGTESNLRLLCKKCNGQRVHDGAVVVDDPDTIAFINAQNSRLAQRIAAETPLRICDDEVGWSTAWRSYRKLPTPGSASPP